MSDGTWVNMGKRHHFYKENEAAFVFWSAVPEADYPASCSIESIDENKWNNNCDESWRN